jgi:hypothetical protein
LWTSAAAGNNGRPRREADVELLRTEEFADLRIEETPMLKKLISTVMILAILAIVPVLCGCNDTDIKTHEHREMQTSHQEEVVE